MSDLGKQGGIKPVSDDPALVGKNPGEPSRPDTSSKSTIDPPALPSFGNNDKNKAR